MVNRTNPKQISIEDFGWNFEQKLEPNNRWVRLADRIPWDEFRRIYHKKLKKKGRPAKDARLVIGAMIIKYKKGMPDEEVIPKIQENPYLQYFVGLKAFTQEEPQQGQANIEKEKIPDQYLGYWNGNIATYEGDIPVTLNVDQDNGFRIKIDDNEATEIETSILSGNFIMGYFTGTIPTSDGIKYSSKIRLAIVRDGDVLYGQVTIDHRIEELDVKYELS